MLILKFKYNSPTSFSIALGWKNELIYIILEDKPSLINLLVVHVALVGCRNDLRGANNG